LVNKCSAVIFSYFGDCPLISDLERYCPIVRYVPWIAEAEYYLSEKKRDRNTGIYIGSLERFKNAAELVEAIPLILDRSDTECFIVIGPGKYALYIKQLAERYGQRLKYVESVPISDAMCMLQSAGYGYTPVTDCGLCFIGDCWGTGTPLITTHELDGFLHKNIDTLVADGIGNLPKTINTLLKSEDLYERMRQNGRERYLSNHTAQSVAEEYLKVLHEIVALPQKR
jgi:glycosyltransferase involved in cell wall biosynthesis